MSEVRRELMDPSWLLPTIRLLEGDVELLARAGGTLLLESTGCRSAAERVARQTAWALGAELRDAVANHLGRLFAFLAVSERSTFRTGGFAASTASEPILTIADTWLVDLGHAKTHLSNMGLEPRLLLGLGKG